jgi:hypothetical protein
MDGANCTSVRDTLCLVSPGHPRVGGDELNLICHIMCVPAVLDRLPDRDLPAGPPDP